MTWEERKKWIYRARPSPKGIPSFIHSFIRSAQPGAKSCTRKEDARSLRRRGLLSSEPRPEPFPRKTAAGDRRPPPPTRRLSPPPPTGRLSPRAPTPNARSRLTGACAARLRVPAEVPPSGRQPVPPPPPASAASPAAAPGELRGAGSAGPAAGSAGGGWRHGIRASGVGGAGTLGQAREGGAGVAAWGEPAA